MATLDSIQIAVDSLTSSTTTLLNEVTVSKTTLTNSRDAAQAAQAGAETAQTGAQTAQTAAEVAQAAAELALDTFDDRFLGAKEVAPTLDNDGNALLTGAIYWDTAETAMKVWTGSIWKFVTTAVEGVNDKTEFTGIASQTVLTISYDIGLFQVLYNGVLLAAAQYTATNGTSITLTAAVTDNADVITVIRWGAVTTSTFLGTAATKNTGTATGEIPLNSDLTALFAAKAPLASPTFTTKVRVYTSTATEVGLSTFTGNETAIRTTYPSGTGAEISSYQSTPISPYTKTTDIVANSDSTVPSNMRFLTKKTGDASVAERMKLDDTGLTVTGKVAASNTPVLTGSAPVYACRAWVNFNGTGTVAINGSGNVSSITDSGVGTYVVNFTTSMPDAEFSAVASATDLGWGNKVVVSNHNTGQVKVTTFAGGTDTSSNADAATVSAAVFR